MISCSLTLCFGKAFTLAAAGAKAGAAREVAQWFPVGDPVRAEHLDRAGDLAHRAAISRRRFARSPRTGQAKPWSWSSVGLPSQPTLATSAP